MAAQETLTLMEKLSKKIGERAAWKFMSEIAGYKKIPPTIEEFIDNPYYLGDIIKLYPAWRELLLKIYPHPLHSAYDLIILTGAIGQGKTWCAIVGMLYDMCKFLHLKDPHKQYSLGKTKYLFFAIFNTTLKASESNALNDIMSIMKLSPFFIEQNAKVKNRVHRKRFDMPHKIRVISASRANHIRGNEVVGGILDELNFVDSRKDQAVGNFQEMRSRINSRFKLGDAYELPGRFYVASSRKDETGYVEILNKSARKDPRAIISEYSQWDVLGPGGKKEYEYLKYYPIYEKFSDLTSKQKRDAEEKAYINGDMFKVFIGDSSGDPCVIETPSDLKKYPGDHVINVPKEHREEFDQDIFTNLRDLAGIATWSTFRFIHNPRYIIEACSLPLWSNGLPMGMKKSIIDLQFEDDTDTVLDYLDIGLALDKRAVYYVHMDYASTQDRTGIAFTRNCGLVDISDAASYGDHIARACYFQTDLVLPIVRRPGKEVPLDKLESFLIMLKQMGYQIGKFTADQYQSKHSLQTLGKRHFNTEHQSVDKPRDAYDLAKNLLLKRVQVNGEIIPGWRGPNHPLLKTEFEELIDMGVKVDHPDPKTSGTNNKPSKDLTDAVVGSLYSCYHADASALKAISAAQNHAFKTRPQVTATEKEKIRIEVIKQIQKNKSAMI